MRSCRFHLNDLLQNCIARNPHNAETKTRSVDIDKVNDARWNVLDSQSMLRDSLHLPIGIQSL